MLNIYSCFRFPSIILYPLINYNKAIEIHKFQERHFLNVAEYLIFFISNVAEYLMFCHIHFDFEDLTFIYTVFLFVLFIIWYMRIKIYIFLKFVS